MGGLRQEALRRTAASPGLRGPLYPPRSHLQQSHPQHRGSPGNVSLQRLSLWQPAEKHVLIGGRVHSSLLAACAARGISSHPLLRLSWQPLSQRKTGTVSPPAGDGTAATRLPQRGGKTGLSRPLPGSYWFFPLGMPCLPPRAHDRNRRDSSWHRSHKHRQLMTTISRIIVDSALHQLAFSRSTPKCSCSCRRSWFTGSLHLAGTQSKSFFAHPNSSAISASATTGLFPTPNEPLNTHRTVAAQRFSSILAHRRGSQVSSHTHTFTMPRRWAKNAMHYHRIIGIVPCRRSLADLCRSIFRTVRARSLHR